MEQNTCQNTDGYAYTKAAKPATAHTIKVQTQSRTALDFDDMDEYACAVKNCLYAPEHLEITDESGKVVWSQKGFEFLRSQAGSDGREIEGQQDASVNPSLWRNTWLNHQAGLFEVVDGIYQVRGYDMSNLTVIAGATGWIVCDPLISCECARAALDLVNEKLGARPVSAIVISHPHIDHFGGIKGIIDAEAVESGRVPLIVPGSFTHYAASENVHAMNAMQRRAAYQYGTTLPQGPRGTLSMGIGMGQSRGLVTFIRPTDEICEKTETRVIDGVTFNFLLTPETEAPVEMCWYLPEFKALWMAELCNATMHNLYTLRGTQIRDGNAWAWGIAEARALFGKEAQVMFQSHNWPHWGNAQVNEVLENTAAIYKYINDQTLMYMNMGYTPNEISHRIRLPEAMEKVWYTRPYYGTLSHNAKAVYQRYLGWYDANPVHLNPLPPREEALKMIEYMGGDTERILERAAADFKAGQYQWAAQVCNALVFADPDNEKARCLCADALEQLGYQSESGPWRNSYLTAAAELRFGPKTGKDRQATNSGDLARCMDARMMLDYMGILIDGEKAQHKDIKINLELTDTAERYYLHLYHGTLLYYPQMQEPDADADVSMPRLGLAAVLTRNRTAWPKLIHFRKGSVAVLEQLTEDMVALDPVFNIIEP